MVGRFPFGSCAALAAGFLLLAVGVRAQTDVWTGDTSNAFEQGSNYQSGVAPNSGTVVELPSSGGIISFNGPDSVLGLIFDGSGEWNFNNGTGTPSLTIGSSGITPGEDVPNIIVYIYVPIVLGATQTWNGSTNAFLFVGGNVSGNYGLTIDNRVYLVGDNTFTGGLTVANGALAWVGNNGAAGTGTITVQSGGNLQGWSGAYTLPNNVSLETGATLSTDSPADTLTFAGPVSFADSFSQLNLGASSSVAFGGAVTGPGAGILTIAGTGAQLPTDGGSQLVMTGQLSGIQALTISNAQVIMAPTGNAATALGSLDTSALSMSSAYLGLGGSFANEGQVSTFLSTYGPALGPSINGSLGLDSIGNSGTFSDPIDLSNFTSTGFLGLGTTSDVTVTGTITPPGDSNYVFGGGGGVMTVSSNLPNDMAGTTLTMTAAPAPLTLILQGTIGFTGGVTSNGGVLIFDTPTNQAANSMTLNGGYVGYTSAATDITSPNTFLGLVHAGSPSGIIGFDTTNYEEPATISQDINLATLGSGANVFIGTSSLAILTGAATIEPSANGLYQFTGVKGGALTVNANFGGAGDSLVIGLPQPIESNGSQSSVTLGGNNTFTGTTTLNSGTLYLYSNAALSTGDVTVTDNPTYLNLSPVISAPGEPVTLANNISFGSLYYNTPGLVLGSYSSSMLTVNGNLTDADPESGVYGYLGIAGPVTLGGNNTYSGGTVFMGDSPAVTLTSSTAFGTGTVTISSGGTILAGVPSVTISNPIQLNNDLVLGSNTNTNTINLDGPLSGSGDLTILSPVNIPNANSNYSGEVFIDNTVVTIGNELALGTGQLYTSNSTVTLGISNPTINNLSGDSESEIALESGATLTLYTTNNLEEYDGTITGDSTNSVVKTGAGAEYLTGNATYTNGTSINQGTLIAGSSVALGGGPITVNNGGQLATASGAVLTNVISMQPGGSLGGTGTFSPPGGVAFTGGSALNPGNIALGAPIGTLTFTTGVTFGTAGVYDFNLTNAGGYAGTGYSTINANGGLVISATSGSPFVINVATFDGESLQPGQAIFSPTTYYSWTLLSADAILGFAANKFTINTSGFQNDTMGGTFTLVEEGSTTLALDFTPAPEPSTWALLGGGVLLVGLVVRRRRAA